MCATRSLDVGLATASYARRARRWGTALERMVYSQGCGAALHGLFTGVWCCTARSIHRGYGAIHVYSKGLPHYHVPASLYACTPVRLYACTHIRLYTCAPVRLYAFTPLRLYAFTPVRPYARTPFSFAPVRLCALTPLCPPLRLCTCTPLCLYAFTP